MNQATQKNAETKSHLDKANEHIKAADESGADAQQLIDQVGAMIESNEIHDATQPSPQAAVAPARNNQALFLSSLAEIQTVRLALAHRLGEFPPRI